MNTNREQLKAELTAQVQKGQNSQKLLEMQGEVIAEIKKGITDEMALVSATKEVSRLKFMGITIRKETRSGLERIEALQADLRVITAYENILQMAVAGVDVAKMNLEQIDLRS